MFMGRNNHLSGALPLPKEDQLQCNQILQPANSALASARAEPRAIKKAASEPPPRVSIADPLEAPSHADPVRTRFARITRDGPSAESPIFLPSQGPPIARFSI